MQAEAEVQVSDFLVKNFLNSFSSLLIDKVFSIFNLFLTSLNDHRLFLSINSIIKIVK